jgi:protein SCO1
MCCWSRSPSTRRTIRRQCSPITPPIFKQDPARWFFLTGDMDKLNDLGVHAFKLNSVDGSLSQTTRFVLVDRRRRIRGFYIYGEDGFMPQLLHDVRQLHGEPKY